MTSRKRNSATTSSSTSKRHDRKSARTTSQTETLLHRRTKRRQHLLETLEARQLLAGPQLIGIQPNEGELIVEGTRLSVAPRALTFRFDANQQIDLTTVDGIRISRAGGDGIFNTADDVTIVPGLVTLGDPNENEVVVRFNERLPDDSYRIELFGFDDAERNITALRNVPVGDNELGEALQPSVAGQGSERIDFDLKLGALIEAVVPQPVIRLEDGTLRQNRDEVVVYFNEDPLFVENDAAGNPTIRSAEHPRFYQLLFTQETVRNTDDLLFHPTRVVYDQTTHTARLFFADDLNQLPGVPHEGGTWRIRIGTAVDDRADLILPPTVVPVRASSVNDFQHPGLRVTFFSRTIGEAGSGLEVRFTDSGVGGLTASLDAAGNVVFDLGGTTPSFRDIQGAIGAAPSVTAVIGMNVAQNGIAGAGIDLLLPVSVVGALPLQLHAVGDTLETALDIGVFGTDGRLSSLVFREAITPQPFLLDLPGGGNTNPLFGNNGTDNVDGITDITYNFNGIFASSGQTAFLNQINERQRERVREALNLWSAAIGVQFRETVDQGITFAVGDPQRLNARPGTQLQTVGALNSRLRIDPTFDAPAIVFSNQVDFGTLYGEDFVRKAAGGIGLLLGLQQTAGLPAQTLMAFAPNFLNATINPATEAALRDLEPVFPGRLDILHGQHLHRPDSIDVDLYRFQVDFGATDKVGTVTLETFAERLPDASSLDTTLTLFQETTASATTDFGLGVPLSVRFDALRPGQLGNRTRLEFFQSDRTAGDTAVRITQAVDDLGQPVPNGIFVDMPRRSTAITSVPVGDIVSAINNDPFAASLVRASIAMGSPATDISAPGLNQQPVLLSGGGLEQLSRNDDYFSEDSRIIASLASGTYYVGVAASGNDTYDPTIAGSGFGGRSQGVYELHVKFEPQVDATDVIRDLDSERVDVPGTPLDGNGDGRPGGVHNFWFQTRPEFRTINFDNNGDGITAGQTIRVIGANGITRTYQFVEVGTSPAPGNIAVPFNSGASGFPTPAGNMASALLSAINSRQNETGVSVSQDGTQLEFRGERDLELSTNFRGVTVFGRNVFVDKAAGPQADGSLARPFNNIANPNVPNAFGASFPGDIVRILGNGGLDNDITTEVDNFSYQIGVSETGGITLVDGRNLLVPKGVTTIIDAGAILKLRNARIGVGSSTVLEDRSGGVLQVLGTPRLVNLSLAGEPVTTTLIASENSLGPGFSDGSVIITSIKDRQADAAAAGTSTAPAPGDWGGIVMRRDLDESEGRSDLEDEGIFLQHLNHAQIRYGGSGNLLIDSVQQLVNPIQVFNMRPTISFNEITFSADAALSASPDSFEETSYQSPQFQQAGAFTADYSRVGPDIKNNLLVNNSINGLFVRIATTPNESPRELTTSARFDDTDVVHYFSENLVFRGTPGGSIQDGIRPDLSSTAVSAQTGGQLAAGTYDYRMTFVDAAGFESLASTPSSSVTVTAGQSIALFNLPTVPQSQNYVFRRLYRLNPATGQYVLVTRLDASSPNFVDVGGSSAGSLDLTREGIRGRLDASLVIDPGTILKFRGARFELGHGTQLLAEGLVNNPIVFTSFADDRFGVGGTFDTNNDLPTSADPIMPQRGDWSGLYAGPTARISLDHATVAFGGGISLLPGGQSRGFAALELQQAEGRIANTTFESNADGQAGAGPVGRFGRLGITPSTIFVRGSQPVIVGNTFIDNRGSTIGIDSDSMTAQRLVDVGRQTGASERFAQFDDNYGPLIRLNRFENVPATPVAARQISGLEIRGGALTTDSVWDDTDIVHLVFDSISVGNYLTEGGLRLISRPDQSLVVKFTGSGTPFSDTAGTGLTALGLPSDSGDRTGAAIQIVGLPGAPVVLTSFADDSVGAGLTPSGKPFTDNNGDGFGSRPMANDWRGIFLGPYSNDRNFDYILEQSITTEVAPGLNGTVNNAQVLGQLAPNLFSGDENLRLGFEVEGLLSEVNDVDTYSFTAEAGTRIWIDVDRTHFGLDSVVEVLDSLGNVLARSNNSFDEVAGTPLQAVAPSVAGTAGSLQGGADVFTEFNSAGVYADQGSSNPRDAGLRVTLPGNPGTRSVFFFRVRSASINPGDAAGGITSGGYRFQVRLREEQEFPGSVVRFADIRYANHGIHVKGLMGESPLLGEAQENEALAGAVVSNNTLTTGLTISGQRAQYLGNLTTPGNRHGGLSVGGELSTANDIDFYQIDVSSPMSAIFDIDYADGFNRPDTSLYVFYDPDGEAGAAPPRLVLVGHDSNVLDDQALGLASNNSIELLSRGSISSGDPFIGPVTLSAGTYFVAVVGNGIRSDAFSSPLARVEPIESVLRIFEDHVESIGGSTALAPREGAFIDSANLPVGWSITTARASDPGHQQTGTFNRSRLEAFSPPSVQNETGGNNETFATAQDLSAGNPLWSLAENVNIGDLTRNTSRFIPHTTVNGTTINDLVDIYRFDVPASGSTVILDIDNGFNPDTDPTGLPDGVNPVIDPTSVDLKLQLFDFDGNLLLSSSSSSASWGQLGSRPNRLSSLSNDPFIQTALTAGTYFVAVSPEATTFDPVTGIFSLDPANRPTSGTYQLHVSVSSHPAAGGDPGNQSYRFDRTVENGTLSSVPFDLTGYGADDLPKLYFNYFYDPGLGDQVRVVARSDQNPGGSSLNVNLTTSTENNVWLQATGSLSDFAGHTGIVIDFIYTTNLLGGFAEGLYLDDFIVGFAERGEMVTNAPLGAVGFTGFSDTVAGEYQLEVRPGTPHATPVGNRINLTNTFDTNARQAEATTLIAPHADQLRDGDTFTLSDGVRSVRFEFDLNTAPGFTSGNIRIAYRATDSQADIARAIRNAINLPVVQSIVNIQASDSTGSVTGNNRDVRVVLSGLVLGDFLALDTPSDLPASGDPLDPDGGPFRMPVVFEQGFGDANVQRVQSQVIVEQNKISNTHGIGVWIQPGDRGVDPQDPVNVFLDRARIGNSSLGAVRNLPTLNTEVLGGLAPGAVIRNNTIDNPGFAGIKVDGEMRPYVIDSSTFDFAGTSIFGDLISDGLTMTIDAGDVRVVFEFEDIGGSATNGGGSGVLGGNGFADGHVPIYFRRTNTGGYLGREPAHTRHEVMRAIYDAIQSSILVTNGIVPLVDVTLGSSLRGVDQVGGTIFDRGLSTSNAAVYINGATNIQFSFSFRNPPPGPALNPFNLTGLAPIHEAPQPVARIVNNTIWGDDGTWARFAADADSEPNDLLRQAVDMRIGSSHAGPYIQTATLGNPGGFVVPEADVDFYRTYLAVGDRLVVDIDTIAGGPNTTLRLFDAQGNEVARNDGGFAPDHLETADNPANFDSQIGRAVDPFLDFTATSAGNYYIGISSAGNDAYQPDTLSGRVAGHGGTGEYTISAEVYAPRSFVLFVDNGSNARFPNANQGIDGAALIGTTFTITQIPDRVETRDNNPTNQLTFQFTAGGAGQRLPNGNINIPIRGGQDFRIGDITRAIARAISGDAFVRNANTPNPPLGNHDFANGPVYPGTNVRASGPLPPVTASALGGQGGGGAGLRTFPLAFPDFNTRFGHNRTGNQVNSNGFAGTSTDGAGVSEMYVWVQNAAKIEISPEAAAAGLRMDPAPNANIDQLLPETGILLTAGSSGTVLNNVLANLHQGVVLEETRFTSFGNNNDIDVHPKQAIAIVTGNAFQHIETANNVFRQNMTSPFTPNGDIGIIESPSNINGGSDDFNLALGNQAPLFVDPMARNFMPADDALIIDSAINSLTQRDSLASIFTSVGLPVGNILSPDRDVNGVLRADHPDFAPPGGLGSQTFKDRGSVERADFVGPVATLITPLDNDPLRIDSDPAVSFVQLTDGTYRQFQIQLRDNGDNSDPFTGIGVDDSTVQLQAIDGLRGAGANVTVFENDRLLVEGIDYTFSYDFTQNVITLTPLAGIWRNDRAYRIGLNNADRTVLIAPRPSDVFDGDQFSIVDSTGGRVVFEYELGFSLLVPEVITLTVPRQGTNAGGLRNGDIFLINDGQRAPVVFEFNTDNATLPGSVLVPLPTRPTPLEETELSAFLNEIAASMQTAIQSQIDSGRLNIDVRMLDNQVIVGAEPGATATTTGSGLLQAARTLSLVVPASGTQFNGVNDGERFTIHDGRQTTTFELNTVGGTAAGAIGIPLFGALDGAEVAQRIATAIASNLALNPMVQGTNVFLNLPVTGTVATSPGSRLAVVGMARTAADGDTLTIVGTDGGAPVVLEINRTDEPDDLGNPIDDGVSDPNIPVNITRATTARELASQIAAILQTQSIVGIDPNALAVLPGGALAIGSQEGLQLDINSDSLEIVGSPGVTEASTIEVFGPLILQMPLIGGSGLLDGTTIIIRDDAGARRFFEFDLFTDGTLNNPAAIAVRYNSFDTADVLSNSLVAAINAAGLGVTAVAQGSGQISLGRIDGNRVELPLMLRTPRLGGASIPDASTLTLTNNQGTPFVFEFDLDQSLVNPDAIRVPYTNLDSAGFVGASLVEAINTSGVGIVAEDLGQGLVSFGQVPLSRASLGPNSVFSLAGFQGQPLRRAIVSEKEVLVLRQGNETVRFEFVSAVGGGGVAPGNIAVPFQPGSSVGDVAVSLAAAINNNRGNLRLNAVAERDGQGQPTGQVSLNDLPGTVVDVSDAPTLNVTGVPGGAIPVFINPSFTDVEVRRALINAINSINQPGQAPATTLSAADRGGNSLFVSNGVLFEGPIENFFVPGIKDLAGNQLEENRDDLTTQFTILMPTVGLDFGDAPDPVSQVPGRYPTLLRHDGARHVIDDRLRLGRLIDADLDGNPTPGADGDDLTISVSSQGTLFDITISDGVAEISLRPGVNMLTRDGDTITIDLGVAQATLELDLDGRFNENNYAIRPVAPINAASIAQAIAAAIAESPLQPAEVVVDGNVVRVSANDEDGVVFGSEINPAGILNKGVLTPISVTVTGSGVVDAWIDFNVDGDWDDPGEHIISIDTPGAIFVDTGEPVTRVFYVTVPATAPNPPGPLDTYARFRVSREGGLKPTGLALSGEVEDYRVRILPGLPPTLTDANANRTFTVEEDRPLQVLDVDGTLTPTNPHDDSLLVGVVDPDGDDVAIFAQDVGVRTLTTPGGTVAGELEVFGDGTFTFIPAPDFNSQASGLVTFSVRVTDVNPLDPSAQLVNSRPINVTINVTPVNDPPFAITPDVSVTRTMDEDEVQIFTSAELIDPFYLAGPENELAFQTLIFHSAGSAQGNAISSMGGSISIANGGTTLIYTPLADFNGIDTFTYVVADVPGAGQLSEVAATLGTVTLNINPVNDPPRLMDDFFATEQDTPLIIPIRGTPENPGILDNDTPGPPDEVAEGQTVSLQSGQFPKSTFRGGSVRLEGDNLIYAPPALFSGIDQFEYTAVDNLGLSATATVSITIGGVNNAPRFVGIDGDPSQAALTFTESKDDPVQYTFNLITWFSDPDGDAMTFTVTSSDSSLVGAAVQGELLTLTLPPFAPGTVNLSVTARDTSGLSTTQTVPVTVIDTPDAPRVIGSLHPLNALEDELITRDLTTVFFDPDGDVLQYSVARLGNLVNPTTAQIAQHPLVKSITTVGDQLRITLQPDQWGSVEIELAASDGQQRVSDTFTLNVASVPDAPVAVDDGYNVPVGSTLQILNPADGLLRNDFDADGDTFQVDLSTVTPTSLGTLQVNADGTFTYASITGSAGQSDTFTYQLIDSTGLRSEPATVTLTLNQSAYQNPIQGMESDVNADGRISAIDALRVINFLQRRLGGQGVGELPVSQIGTPPPDYLDVDGNGRISANDAFRVINELNRHNTGSGEGEFSGDREFVFPTIDNGGPLAFATTTAFAAASSANLPVRNFSPAEPETRTRGDLDPRDTLLAAGLEIDSRGVENATLGLASDIRQADSLHADEIDEALADLFDELQLDGPRTVQ